MKNTQTANLGNAPETHTQNAREKESDGNDRRSDAPKVNAHNKQKGRQSASPKKSVQKRQKGKQNNASEGNAQKGQKNAAKENPQKKAQKPVKYDDEYIRYVEHGDSAIVFIARDLCDEIPTKKRWIDVLDREGARSASRAVVIKPQKTPPLWKTSPSV